MAKLAREHSPKLIIAGGSAYPRHIDFAKFRAIADEVGAYTMADMAHIAGMIAGKALRNPFEDGFDVITTTTHKSLRGPRGGLILCKMPQEMVDQRTRYYRDRTIAELNSAEDTYMRDSDERMKKVLEKRRQVVFGR